jgi:hypothetical protein
MLVPTIVPSILEACMELDENIDKFSGIIVDVMLKKNSVRDLEQVGVHGADTRLGVVAGLVFIDRYLRRSTEEPKYQHIPILVLTNRPEGGGSETFIKNIAKRGGAPIDYIEKGFDDWSVLLENWIKSILHTT